MPVNNGGKSRDLTERYSRQILFDPIGKKGQELLLESRVAIIGMGALGTVSADCLARAGVGGLKLVDRDFVEESNLQRQVLFDEDDARSLLPKVIAAEKKLKKINPGVSYEALFLDINYTNILDVLGDVDLVMDATDNIETRLLINEACVKKNIPWIHGACVSSRGISFNIIPGKTPCLVCFWGHIPLSGTGESCDTVGVISPVVNVIASVQCAEALKILTNNHASLNKKALFFDLWNNIISELEIERNDNCDVCGKARFRMLAGETQQRSTVLCGADAVQVLPSSKLDLSMEELSKKLAPLGEVYSNTFLLKFSVDSYQLIIFSDGRALVKGTKDKAVARTLYARYIGA